MRSEVSEEYTVRLSGEIADAARRAAIAEALAPQLKLRPDQADRLLAKTSGNLIRPTSRERAERIAAMFREAGAAVELVPLGHPLSPEPAPAPASPTLAPVPSAAAEPEPDDYGRRPKGWVSLRWKLLGLALAPMLVVGAAWVTSTLTTQAEGERALLVQGAVQTASVFSQSVLDLMESSGQGLDSPELRANVQQRMSDLFQARLLPLDFAVVTDPSGAVVAAFDRAYTGEAAPESAFADPVGTWRSTRPAGFEAVRDMAVQTARYNRPATAGSIFLGPGGSLARSLDTREGPLTLAAYPLPGGAGATILSLTDTAIRERVNASVSGTLLRLALVFALVALLAAVFASGLIRRLVGLARAADRISLGELDESVEVRSRDEISDLANAVERMRVSLEAAISRLSRR